MFRIGVLVRVPHGIAQQQVLFSERVDVLTLDGGVGVARLPDAPVVQVLKVFRPVEIEEVRAGIVPILLSHAVFQRQKVRHHDFRAPCGEFTEHDVVMSPNLVGVVLHVFPMAGVKPARSPQDFIRYLGCCGRMLVLEIAHAHAAGDTFRDAVFEQLDVRNLSRLGKEVFYLAFGGKKIPIGAEFP